MDPYKMSLDEIINFRFCRNSTGNDQSSPMDLTLNHAGQQAMGPNRTTRKRSYETSQSTNAYRRAPIQKIRLRNIDPMTHSLDDIIEEVMEVDDDDDDMQNSFKPSTISSSLVKIEAGSGSTTSADEQSRQNDATSTGTIGSDAPLEYPEYTPYRAVAYLARKGAPVTILVGARKNWEFMREWSHKWRCIISSGDLKVVADSSRKQVAREMAAVEFLEQYAKMDNNCKIQVPEYAVLPEVFINPRIFHMLEKAAIERNLDTANYVAVRPVTRPKRHGGCSDLDYLFVATYLVGKAAYKGESFVEEYAKLQAAKRAYEGLTGKVLHPIKYFTGDLCDPALEFDYGESEISQVVFMKSETEMKPPAAPEAGKPLQSNYRRDDRSGRYKKFSNSDRDERSGRFKKFRTDAEKKAPGHMPGNVKTEPES